VFANGFAGSTNWVFLGFWMPHAIRRFVVGVLTGRPKYYTQETHGKVIALARTKPESLGYPFTCWTIRRLSTALWETERLNLAISVIWRWIKKEGLVWKKQQTWFNVPRDEEFVEKRGP